MAKNTSIDETRQGILLDIQKILKHLCEANSDFVDIIMSDLNNSSIKSVTFNKSQEGLIKVEFIITLPDLGDYPTDPPTEFDCKCELQINNYGFEYKRTQLEKSRTNDEHIHIQVLSCKKDADTINFCKEKLYEYKSIWVANIPRSHITASNEINTFNVSQQISREKNEVNIICFPSDKGELDVAKSLNRAGLKMSITNPLALKILNRLNYSVASVETNHSEHSEIWPILENSVVNLISKESINYDNTWDGYDNDQIMFVGDNRYRDHTQIDTGAMYFTYGRKERDIAEQYFDGSISIKEVLQLSGPILLNYTKRIKNQNNEQTKLGGI